VITLVLIQPVAADAIASAAKYAVPLETGGILVGHHEDDMLVITHAITVPAMSASGSRYTRDDLSANAALSDYLLDREPSDPAGYVGEWHSHPACSGVSSVDIRSIREIAHDMNSDVALLVAFPTVGDRLTGVIASRTRMGRVVARKTPITVIPLPLDRTDP